MDDPASSSDIAFTPAVKAIQTRLGSRATYERLERNGGWQTRITPDLAAFVAEQISFFMATASADGQPYIQHRGGPPGFLTVLDEHTLAFADFGGNRQYISMGNLSENARCQLFLIDYVNRQRIKVWGEARVVEDDPGLLTRLAPPDYRAKPERVFLVTVKAWDANCPKHIPQRFDAIDVEAALAQHRQRIAELEAALAQALSDAGRA